MKFEEFWEKYLEQKITDISGLAIEVFSQPLSEDIVKEYELGEIITEFSGHHEDAKAFDKIEEFAAVLRKHQPELYYEEGAWLESSLISYYCFKKDSEKIRATFEHIVHTKYDYDILLLDLWSVFLCDIEEAPQIIEHVTEQIYEDIKNSSKLVSGAEQDLDAFMFHIEKEKHWDEGNWEQFAETMSNYQYNLDQEYVEQLQKGWSATIEEGKEWLATFPKDTERMVYALIALRTLFIKNTRRKGMPVRISSMIWDSFERYFYENQGRPKTWSRYFSFEKKSLVKFLDSEMGLIIDRSKVVVMLTWGASYLLDFFKALALRDGKQLEQQKKLLSTVQRNFKAANTYFLWRYTFVHDWEPADTMDSELQEDERKAFMASFEMEEPPVFSGKDIFDNVFIDNDISLPPSPPSPLPPSKPVRTSKKYGRNEKVTVQYADGTIKENVKYKHVLQDIEKGECEIIS